MNVQLLIPNKIKVGYQQRSDTYTKMLAYVIYYDTKGVLRKENSWNSWRDHKIKDTEFENVPTSGFVINKGVGGVKESYYWNARNEYVRVYDPRGFEIEISVSNLLFILNQCNCFKGKGIEEELIYCWLGTELTLLPIDCEEYRNSIKYTSLQNNKISAKDLKIGATYETKTQQSLIYLGKYTYYDYYSWRDNLTIRNNMYVFSTYDGKFHEYKDLKNIAVELNDNVVDNYSDLIDSLLKNEHYGNIKKIDEYSFKVLSSNFDKYDYVNKIVTDCRNDKYTLRKLFIQKTDDNKYNLYKIYFNEDDRKRCNSDTYGYRYHYYGSKYTMEQTGIVEFINGKLIVKSKKGEIKIISNEELAEIEFTKLYITIDNCKKTLELENII